MTETVENTEELEFEDLDVDTSDAEDEVEEETEAKPAKAPKEKKEKAPARPPVAEGYITPVAFAKVLTTHLAARGATNKHGLISEESNPIPPQMVYSYMRNNAAGDNPIPVYTDAELTGGRAAVLKTEEALAWWDAKDERIANSRKLREEKEQAKKEKAAKAAEAGETVEAEAEVEETEEAE